MRSIHALSWLGIDQAGFDDMDRQILLTIIEKFNGGPVGIESLAAAVQEDKGTLEDVYEPYLIQAGFLERTGRGPERRQSRPRPCGSLVRVGRVQPRE